VANGQLQVDFSDYLFRVIANSEPYVKLESQEISDIFAADRDDREVIASCSARYGVLAPDDPAMDHFNDFLYLLHAFEAAYDGAVAFDSVSGISPNPAHDDRVRVLRSLGTLQPVGPRRGAR